MWNFFSLCFKLPSLRPSAVFIDYCGIVQNIEKQCVGTFIADVYMKIFEDNVLNNFDRYMFFSQIFVKYVQIKIRDTL